MSLLLILAMYTSFGFANAQAEISAAEADRLYQNKKWAEAAQAYEQVLPAHPEDSDSAKLLADCYEQLGEYQKAITAYQAASKIEAQRGYSLYSLSLLYLRTGDKERALTALNKAIDNGFDDGRTVINNVAFNGLRDDRRFLQALRRLLGPGFTGFDRVEPTKDDMRRGIKLLVETARKRSPNPYRRFSPAEWDARTSAALRKVASLDATSYYVELVGLAGMIGDVHTAVVPGASSKVLRDLYSLRFWKFADGLYIRAAAAPQSRLVGAKVIAIQGVPIESAWQRLIDKLPEENEWMSAEMAQAYLQFPGFLHAIGLGENDRQGRFTLQLADGREEESMISATESGGWSGTINSSLGMVTPESYVEDSSLAAPPLWLKNRDRNYWSEYLPAKQAMFLQINTPRNDRSNPWDKFLEDLFQSIREKQVERLIVDLRHNGGGYGYMAQKLVHYIIATPAIDRPGHLFVLTSRITQSAGVIFAVELEGETHSIFVGEPLAAHPNFFNAPMGRHVTQALPGTDLYFRVADRMHQTSDHQDDRRFLAPDIPVPLKYVDYAGGRDPVLDAALQFDPREADRYFEDEGGRPLPLYFRWRRPSQRIAFTQEQWIRLKR